jgi:hypothetical protein
MAVSGGQQVGSGASAGNSAQALLWSGTAGSFVNLNPAGFTLSEAVGVSGGQQIGDGYGPSTGNNYHALLWSGTAGSYVDLNPSGFTSSRASGVCGGQQVGSATDAMGGQHALTWFGTAESYVDLNTFLPPGYGGLNAYAIDASGNIVGVAYDVAAGQDHAVMWGEIILPAPPSLNITRTGRNFAVVWPSSFTNYLLQSNATLNSLTWSNFGGTASDNGTNKSISLGLPAGQAFFRLLSTNGP